jgi:hypothetical protein
VNESFSTSPLSCATLSSTGAGAVVNVSWKGRVFGQRASFSPTQESDSRSDLVTSGNGHEGFDIPGSGGSATAIGSFPAASGSTASAFTVLTSSALASTCQKGVRTLKVTGTITIGSPVAPSGPFGLGDYAGSDNPQGVFSFGQATGTDPSYATDYLDKTDGWAAMDSADIVRGWAGTGYRLVLGVPILPGTGTLAEGAAGDYNGYFATLAQNLVDEGEGGAILRLGWEFNGNWYPWSVQSTGDAANFVTFWQQIVTTMRAVPGENFQFLWNPSADTPTSYDPSAAYPGDAYVDYVGTDAYDEFYGSPFTPSAAWANQLSQQWGLDWLASFAAAHNKPIAIPEWSVAIRYDDAGLGDDPLYVNNMHAWFLTHNVAFADIFSFDSPGFENDILDGNFPQSLAAFRADFG